MSGHYTASQYNEPFMPKRLRNWSFGVNPWPGGYAGCPRRCPTTFIANDNGHLFSHIFRNACTSPWGDYRTSVWEETHPCLCVDKLRNPQYYRKSCPKMMVSPAVPCPSPCPCPCPEVIEVCQEPCPPAPSCDPCEDEDGQS